MNSLRIIIGLASISLLSACSIVTSKHQSWEFIESVGGLRVAGQDKNPNWLIVRGDVSGLSEFSCKPTSVNSALAVKEIECDVDGDTILLYVVTTLAGDSSPTSKIAGAKLPSLNKGRYKVQYLNPDGSTVDLKSIEIY